MRGGQVRRQGRVIVRGALAAGLALAMSAAAQQQSVAPGINERFEQGKDYGEFVHQFEREGREIYDKRLEILGAIGLKPGMAVADIGAGSGLFSQLFSREVGDKGRVYA